MAEVEQKVCSLAFSASKVGDPIIEQLPAWEGSGDTEWPKERQLSAAFS